MRLVAVDPRGPWLGDVDAGLAVADARARRGVHAALGRKATIDTIDGPLRGEADRARAAALRTAPSQAEGVARTCSTTSRATPSTTGWLRTQETALLGNAVCIRDDLPATGDVDLTAWVPFLGN